MTEKTFEKKELENRQQKAKKIMEKEDLDMLVVTSDENIYYFSGMRPLMFWDNPNWPRFFILPKDGEPVMIMQESLVEDATRQTYIESIETYISPEVEEVSAVKTARDTFKKLGFETGKVGLELGFAQRQGISQLETQELYSSLPGINLRDASSLIWSLRMVKSETEINFMREASQITSKAIQKCFDNIQVGDTEKSVAKLFHKLMMDGGEDEPGFCLINSGEFNGWLPTDKTLKKGDLLLLDGGCRIKRYCCDFDRMATMGEPTRVQKDLYNSIYDMKRELEYSLKPGITASEIAKVGIRVFKEKGLAKFESFHNFDYVSFGHGQGLMVTEMPLLSLVHDTVMVPGMVTSLEFGVSTKEGFFIWEDLYVITEDGYEILSTDDASELRVIE